MKTAIQFGAGNIGRGFIGSLLAKSGYSVIFADSSKTIIPELNSRSEYTVKSLVVKKQRKSSPR